MKKDDALLTVRKAAERLQTTELNVLMHIKRGLLAGEELDGQWYVADTSLHDFINSDRRAKVGVICKTSGCGKGCGSCG